MLMKLKVCSFMDLDLSMFVYNSVKLNFDSNSLMKDLSGNSHGIIMNTIY